MTDRRRNVVLVTVDSLRADHCGCYGYDRETTPTLDAMADRGFVFERAIAPGPSTPESMPVAFTGRYPVERGDGGSDLAARRERIRTHMAVRDTVAERFRRRGYRTGAFTPNPFTSRHFGFDRGFDHFRDFMGADARGTLYGRAFRGFLRGGSLSSTARVLLNAWGREEVFRPWRSFDDEVVEWATGGGAPYFLWVFLMDAHNPYLAPSAYTGQGRLSRTYANLAFWWGSHETPFSDRVHDRLVTAYDDAVRYADAFLARLRGALPEGTAMVVHGDHGEAFGEHGTYGHEPYLHEENVRVPLVVDGAGSGRTSAPVSLRDLPALLDAVAAGESIADPRREYATTRSRQGRRVAVYGRSGRFEPAGGGSDPPGGDQPTGSGSDPPDDETPAGGESGRPAGDDAGDPAGSGQGREGLAGEDDPPDAVWRCLDRLARSARERRAVSAAAADLSRGGVV